MASRTYRLGRRADSAAATRRRILDAGWAEIELAGYRPASVEAIATRAGVTRVTVYRHFASRGELLEAIAWDQVGRAQLDRLDEARAHPDVLDATRLFLHENCLLFDDVGPILRAMLEVEREEPEIAVVLSVTYRGRRLESLRHLAERIASSGQMTAGWTADDVCDALEILTGIEAFEVLMAQPGRTASDAATALFSMARAFLVDEEQRNSDPTRPSSTEAARPGAKSR